MAARFAQGDLQGRCQPHAKTPGRPRENLRSKRMPACGKRAEPDLYKRQTRIPKHSPVFGKGRQRRPREKAHPAIKARPLPRLGREFATCFRDYGIREPLSTKRVPSFGVSNAPSHFWINQFDPVSPGNRCLCVRWVFIQFPNLVARSNVGSPGDKKKVPRLDCVFGDTCAYCSWHSVLGTWSISSRWI